MPDYPHWLKLDTPTKFVGQHRLGVRAWLTQVEHYMLLSSFPTDDWVEIAVLLHDGIIMTSANLLLMEVAN